MIEFLLIEKNGITQFPKSNLEKNEQVHDALKKIINEYPDSVLDGEVFIKNIELKFENQKSGTIAYFLCSTTVDFENHWLDYTTARSRLDFVHEKEILDEIVLSHLRH